MKIEITHNIDDVSAQVIEDVTKAMTRRVDEEVKRISNALKSGVDDLIREITQLLDIKDERQRERVRRAVVKNLDKWTKGNIK